MKYISTNLTQYLINHKVKVEDIELFEFGIRVIIRNMMIFVIALFISTVLGFILSFLFFNSVFLLLRQLTGGYHAKSEIVCFSSSMILVLVIPYIIDRSFFVIPYNALILVSLNCAHLFLNEKPFKIRYLIGTLILLDMIFIIFLSLQLDADNICNCILTAMFSNLIFLFISKLQKSEN